MNNREQFEAWWKTHCNGDFDELLDCWKACAESKQAELDKANARIAQLVSYIKKSHNNCSIGDNCNCGGDTEGVRATCWNWRKPDNTLTEPPDTWLSENNKAVEVKVLEEVNTRLCNHEEPFNLIISMIESRRS